MTTGLRDVSLRHKNHQTQKRKTNQIIRTNPPLSAETEAAFYVEEEERGVYDDFWRNMGYYIEHGVDFPPVIGTINLQLLQGYASNFFLQGYASNVYGTAPLGGG